MILHEVSGTILEILERKKRSRSVISASHVGDSRTDADQPVCRKPDFLAFQSGVTGVCDIPPALAQSLPPPAGKSGLSEAAFPHQGLVCIEQKSCAGSKNAYLPEMPFLPAGAPPAQNQRLTYRMLPMLRASVSDKGLMLLLESTVKRGRLRVAVRQGTSDEYARCLSAAGEIPEEAGKGKISCRPLSVWE